MINNKMHPWDRSKDIEDMTNYSLRVFSAKVILIYLKAGNSCNYVLKHWPSLWSVTPRLNGRASKMNKKGTWISHSEQLSTTVKNTVVCPPWRKFRSNHSRQAKKVLFHTKGKDDSMLRGSWARLLKPDQNFARELFLFKSSDSYP